MDLRRMTSRKRLLDSSNDCKLQELRKHRTMVQAVRDFPPGCGFDEAERKPLKSLEKIRSDLGKVISRENGHTVVTNKFNSSKPKEFGVNKSSGKVKFSDQACMKAGYDQKPKVSTNVGMQRKLVKNVDSNMAPNGNDKLVNSQPVENSKSKNSEPKELDRNKRYLCLRSTGKVKFWDPTCIKEDEAQKSEVSAVIESQKEHINREKIKEAMILFDQFYESLSQENRLKPNGEKIHPSRVPMEVAKLVKRKLKWVDPAKTVGHVSGVQIGDQYKYRAQLKMIGLHCQSHSGIDYAKIKGKNLAISIVDAHRSSNVSGSSDTLVYSGQGGLTLFGCKLPPEDQKLERGNLALKNSMDNKIPVRVIRKIEVCGKEVFVYDGLYIVNHCTSEKSAERKIVFKFHLNRVPDQPSLHTMLKW